MRLPIFAFSLILSLGFLPLKVTCQELEARLQELQMELTELEQQKGALIQGIEGTKLEMLQRDLEANGLPSLDDGEELIQHAALALVYSEAHEQPKWVAHIISSDIIQGTVFRSNDFREDPLVSTGTAIEQDYFLKFLQADSTYTYDGYGYDRGHLAPSADFRWSAKALSESYYYSNISPQLPEFNREIWAELEGKLRAYLYRNPSSQLYVVTGPLLEDNLPVIERSINKVAIPRKFFKVVVDLDQQQAIGFYLPHAAVHYPLESFAVPIDQIEAETGIDFFAALPDDLENKLEAQAEPEIWITELQFGNVEPISPPSLPKNTFNTVQAKRFMDDDRKVNVCGTAVSTRLSRNGNILINLDKQFPNQIFTVFIRKEHILNFPYNPLEYLKGKKICVNGKVVNLGGTPAMFIEHDRSLEIQ